jgi:membrane protein YqaA with SNARE-associated domain
VTAAQLAWLSLATAFTSGFVPVLNLEAFLAGAAALSSEATLLLVVVPATVGQMAAKTLLYLGGRGLVELPWGAPSRVRESAARLAAAPRSAGVVFSSALVGLPPFYLVSVGAGAMRVPPLVFVGLGTVGRFLRFAAVFAGLRLLGLAS